MRRRHNGFVENIKSLRDDTMDWFEYSDTVIEHFMCPRNVGILEDADGVGSCGDLKCGDYLEISIHVANRMIDDIRFLVQGCTAAIAASSMTTELAKGKTLEAAFKISEGDIIDALGGLPANKQHCSVLGAQALKNAITDYYSKNEARKCI